MIDFDSDYLGLPLVPFVIELTDRCFLVKISLCRAEMEEYLPHFDLIEVSISNPKKKTEKITKPVGHRVKVFLATCSTFILIAEDGYQLIFEPAIECYIERKEAEEYPFLSLDEVPADDIEAYEIYEEYTDREMSARLNRVTELLATNQISINHLKNEKSEYDLRGYIDYYLNAKVLFKGFDKIAFGEALIKNALNNNPIIRHKKRVKVKDVDLLVSYHFIRNNQPNIAQDQAREKAIKLKYPAISDDDLAKKSEALKDLIKNHAKDTELNFKFPTKKQKRD